MKLISDLHEEIGVVTESNDSAQKSWYLEGIFLQGNTINGNGRFYPINILSESVENYTENFLSKNRSFGELGHPDKPQINLERVSHIIKSLVREGNNYVGRAKVMSNSPSGKIVVSLIEEGARLGVSSRGLGAISESTSGGVSYKRVDVFHITTAADIVADPSAPDCFVDSLMESKDWVMNNEGVWKVSDLEAAQKHINGVPSRKLQEEKIKIFQKFLENL